MELPTAKTSPQLSKTQPFPHVQKHRLQNGFKKNLKKIIISFGFISRFMAFFSHKISQPLRSPWTTIFDLDRLALFAGNLAGHLDGGSLPRYGTATAARIPSTHFGIHG